MPRFSNHSKEQLATLHPDLQKVLYKAIKYVDFRVLEGHRSNELQNKYFMEGKTQLRAGQSEHNKWPSRAVDIAPWPIDWSNRERFIWQGGVITGIAIEMDIVLRWGGDWDEDFKIVDNHFDDLGHFEIES